MESESTSLPMTTLFEKMRDVRDYRFRLSERGGFNWGMSVEQEARWHLGLPLPYDPCSESASSLFEQFEEWLEQGTAATSPHSELDTSQSGQDIPECERNKETQQEEPRKLRTQRFEGPKELRQVNSPKP